MSLSTLAADTIFLAHLGFILYVTVGGLFVLRWPKSAWAHLPCALWGTLVEICGWTCPLTPLEQKLRHLPDGRSPNGEFIEHYLMPLVYPPGLTRSGQIMLGVTLLLLNSVFYAMLWHRRRRATRRTVDNTDGNT